MKILVTGGSDVIGTATVTELVGRGHQVRLLSRGADDDHADWGGSVEPFTGDVGDAAAVGGAAAGCAAVIHIAGVVDESPPEVTFERVNVGGTANVLRESWELDNEDAEPLEEWARALIRRRRREREDTAPKPDRG